MRFLNLIVVIAALAFSAPVNAFYKCKKPDGSVEYKDFPCVESKDETPDWVRHRKRQQDAAPKYTGSRLSVNFERIQVSSLLQLLADLASKYDGVIIRIHDSVTGHISARYKNVPWVE